MSYTSLHGDESSQPIPTTAQFFSSDFAYNARNEVEWKLEKMVFGSSDFKKDFSLNPFVQGLFSRDPGVFSKARIGVGPSSYIYGWKLHFSFYKGENGKPDSMGLIVDIGAPLVNAAVAEFLKQGYNPSSSASLVQRLKVHEALRNLCASLIRHRIWWQGDAVFDRIMESYDVSDYATLANVANLTANLWSMAFVELYSKLLKAVQEAQLKPSFVAKFVVKGLAPG